MRKRFFLAMLMVAVLMLGTACSTSTNSTADDQTVIIEVAGQTFTKAQVNNATQNVMSYMSYQYSMYGIDYDTTDATVIASAQSTAIQLLVQSAVSEQKIKELGFDVFTDAELAELQKTADTTYQGYMDIVKQGYFADTTLTGDVLTTAIETKMTELGYPDKAATLENVKYNKQQEKLKASVVKDVALTDADIQAEYDSKVEAAKAGYQTTLTQYATDVASGNTIYYRPAGYRYVKNLLIKFTDADSKIISALQTQIADKKDKLDTNTSMIAAVPTDAISSADADVTNRLSKLNDAKATLESEIADLNAQLTAAQEKGYTDIQPTIDEITTKLAAGGDFDALLTQYGQDTGMQSEPAKTEGYLVCTGDTRYVTEFTNAAMALAKAGDVSAPFHTQYGTHIVKYISDLAEGVVPLVDIKDAISKELLTTKQNDLFNTTLNQWVTDANAKIYTDRM